MKAVFYGNRQGNFVDKAIRWWTSPLSDKFNGKWADSYSHVELEFSDGVMFSASQYDNRTRFARRSPNSIAWVEVDLSLSWEEETVVRQFCQRCDNLEYDYAGVVGFVFGNPDENSKWFCSEVCVAALQVVGMFGGINPSKVSPNDMFDLLK